MILFWAKTEIWTPPLCRMVARKKRNVPMSVLDIADASLKLTPAQVESISQSTEWSHIDVETMRDFVTACGIDFCDWAQMHRACEFIRSKPGFSHLRRSPEWKTYWRPLMIRWRKSYGVVTPKSDIWPPLRDLLIRLKPLCDE